MEAQGDGDADRGLTETGEPVGFAAGLKSGMGAFLGMMIPAVVVTKGDASDFHELGPDDPAPCKSPKSYAI